MECPVCFETTSMLTECRHPLCKLCRLELTIRTIGCAKGPSCPSCRRDFNMPLEQATRKDLAAMCKKFNFTGYGRLRKNALIEHITREMTKRAVEERTQRHASEIRQAMGTLDPTLPSHIQSLLDDVLSSQRPRQGFGVYMGPNGMEITNLSTRITTTLSMTDLLNTLQSAGRI
jgi:hypothetical protein